MGATAVERAAAMSVGDYSPRIVINAVNQLRAAGRDAAFERIRTAARAPRPPDATGLLWVMRVLFDMPPRMPFPPPGIGTPDVAPAPDAQAFPRFPVVVFRDVPFLVAHGFILAGLPADLEDDLAFFYDYAIIRSTPLEPTLGGHELEREFLAHWAAAFQDEPAPDISDIVRAQTERLGADPGAL